MAEALAKGYPLPLAGSELTLADVRIEIEKLILVQEQAAEAVAMLIEELDKFDGDPDLEPLLGAPERHPPGGVFGTSNCSQETWAQGASDDREADDDFEPDADAEEDHAPEDNTDREGGTDDNGLGDRDALSRVAPRVLPMIEKARRERARKDRASAAAAAFSFYPRTVLDADGNPVVLQDMRQPAEPRP